MLFTEQEPALRRTGVFLEGRIMIDGNLVVDDN